MTASGSLLDVDGAGDATNSDLIACAWRKGTDLAIVAANITGHDAQGLRARSAICRRATRSS